MLKYVYYQSDRGDQPVMEFIYGLPLRDRKKIDFNYGNDPEIGYS
ncbi:hypothetical protein [Paucilactobacillus hokkaidonensis]|nr:hypothetical protein [Paucilactobacillus hokkaidonensis]